MLVAVYGTLKRNFSNHEIYMKDALFMANIVVPGIMFSLRHFPGIILHDSIGATNPARDFCLGYKTHAEVYSVDANQLADLDFLEGHPEYYCRLPYNHEILGEVWVYTVKPYLYLRGKQEIVPGGVWGGYNTTVQHVDFGEGNCKPKVMAWTGNASGVRYKPTLPQQYQKSSDSDFDEEIPLSTVHDKEDPEPPEHEGIVIDIDEDITVCKEAS